VKENNDHCQSNRFSPYDKEGIIHYFEIPNWFLTIINYNWLNIQEIKAMYIVIIYQNIDETSYFTVQI
jgi:hypothetical protein